MALKIRNLPGKVLVDLILVLHPGVSINKELQESQERHGTESDQGHCGGDAQAGHCSCWTSSLITCAGRRSLAHLFLQRPRSPRSSPTLWGRRPALSPSSGLSYETGASSSPGVRGGPPLLLHLQPSQTDGSVQITSDDKCFIAAIKMFLNLKILLKYLF